ncbi:hypothetical protein KR074_002868 [Drosophila pseudoananassae]|nr:hypothetical protein KR074_002868 [Drosophila pseudoananassae]
MEEHREVHELIKQLIYDEVQIVIDQVVVEEKKKDPEEAQSSADEDFHTSSDETKNYLYPEFRPISENRDKETGNCKFFEFTYNYDSDETTLEEKPEESEPTTNGSIVLRRYVDFSITHDELIQLVDIYNTRLTESADEPTEYELVSETQDLPTFQSNTPEEDMCMPIGAAMPRIFINEEVEEISSEEKTEKIMEEEIKKRCVKVVQVPGAEYRGVVKTTALTDNLQQVFSQRREHTRNMSMISWPEDYQVCPCDEGRVVFYGSDQMPILPPDMKHPGIPEGRAAVFVSQ